MLLELAKIRIDGGTQPRAEIDQETVDEYAEAFGILVHFPPIIVYFDGVHYWLADGFHRYHAVLKRGEEHIDAEERLGTVEEAKIYAASANSSHGLKRKDVDKRRAIEMVWSTARGKTWTQVQIAKHCHVGQSWVSDVIGKYRTDNKPKNKPVAKTENKRTAIERALFVDPTASDRAIARALGVDRATVAKVRKEKAPAEPKSNEGQATKEGESQPPEPEASTHGHHGHIATQQHSNIATQPRRHPSPSVTDILRLVERLSDEDMEDLMFALEARKEKH